VIDDENATGTTIAHNEDKESDAEMEVETRNETLAVNDYLIVNYMGKKYPGRVLEVLDSGVRITAMEATKAHWKWPDRPDILVYSWNEISQRIGFPNPINNRGPTNNPINNRGQYRVIEMERGNI